MICFRHKRGLSFFFYFHIGANVMAKKKPVQEVRLGRIRAAIWENDTQNGVRHNVTFSRLYLDDDGNWQDSASFGRDDLPLLCKVADRTHTWIFELAKKVAAESSDSAKEEVPF